MSDPVHVPFELLQGGVTVTRPGSYRLTGSTSTKKYAPQHEITRFDVGVLDIESHTESLSNIDLTPYVRLFVYHEGTCIIDATRSSTQRRVAKR